MAARVENGALRRPHNRAVAAILEWDAFTMDSSFMGDDRISHKPILQNTNTVERYSDFSSLLQHHLKPDPHHEARETLKKLQMVRVLRDEFEVLSDAILKDICVFLGNKSCDVVRLGAVCRRLRNLVITLTPAVVVVVPDMIPLESIRNHTIVDSICAFFAPYKRGQFVQHLQLVDAKYASSLPVSVTLPFCSSHVFPALPKFLPALTFLDLRGVLWDVRANPNLPKYFFSDLHIVAPKLQTLKVGVELFRQWSAGWWRNIATLESIVVGSRRDQALIPGVLPQCIALHDDIFGMLHGPHRVWKLKLWCALQRDGLIRLLLPQQPFPGLQELTLNIANMEITEEIHRPRVKTPRSASSRKSAAKNTTQAPEEVDVRMVFPSLCALTLADVDQCPTLLAELLNWLVARAPKLRYFSVVNTARIPPSPRPKRRG